MDQHYRKTMDLRIERTVKALCANNYDAHYIKDTDALMLKLDEYMPQGVSCSVGGSMTLNETGVMDYIKRREKELTYYDRYAEGIDPMEVFRQALGCDVYLTSTNAVTEDGMLYNMDGNSNRVAAMIFGPKKVVVIIGENKIVKDVEAARQRVRQISAPANNIRLNTPNPCTKTGRCVDCKSDLTSCVTEVVQRRQRNKGRIAVLVLPEAYGY